MSRMDWLQGGLVGMVIFDLVLGGTALVKPSVYMTWLHPGHEGAISPLVQRTGTLWLVFACVQAVAAYDPATRPDWLLAAGVLRLMDVPADLVYYIVSRDLGRLGTIGLLVAPLFNLASGGLFVYVSRSLPSSEREEGPMSP